LDLFTYNEQDTALILLAGFFIILPLGVSYEQKEEFIKYIPVILQTLLIYIDDERVYFQQLSKNLLTNIIDRIIFKYCVINSNSINMNEKIQNTIEFLNYLRNNLLWKKIDIEKLDFEESINNENIIEYVIKKIIEIMKDDVILLNKLWGNETLKW
jgi:hypothetical protein